jgi:hypothetical protein
MVTLYTTAIVATAANFKKSISTSTRRSLCYHCSRAETLIPKPVVGSVYMVGFGRIRKALREGLYNNVLDPPRISGFNIPQGDAEVAANTASLTPEYVLIVSSSLISRKQKQEGRCISPH